MKKIILFVILFSVIFSIWAIFFAEEKHPKGNSFEEELNAIQADIDKSMRDIAYEIYTNKDYGLCNPLVHYTVVESHEEYLVLNPTSELYIHSIILGNVYDVSDNYIVIAGIKNNSQFIVRITLLDGGKFTVKANEFVNKCNVLGEAYGKIKVEVYDNNLFVYIDPNLVINK